LSDGSVGNDHLITSKEEIKMANVNQISVLIKTGAQGMADGTHGDAYLGIGCKEFHLTEFRDKYFQPGQTQTIVLSELSEAIVFDERTNIGNCCEDSSNSCYPYEINSDNLPQCPLYIRFKSGSKYDYWDLEEIKVTVDVGSEHIVFSALGEKSYLWSGVRGPKVMYLGEQQPTTTH
jgi:uncharacterized protein (DUF779 family)